MNKKLAYFYNYCKKQEIRSVERDIDELYLLRLTLVIYNFTAVVGSQQNSQP